jgi:hypothetical protein
MAFAKYRYIAFDYEEGHAYPYVCTAWRMVGGMNVGDRFTEQVGEVIIEALREDGITIDVTQSKPEEVSDG